MAWTVVIGDKTELAFTDAGDRAWVPVRFVAQALDMEVRVDDWAKRIELVPRAAPRPQQPNVVAPCDGTISQEFGARPKRPDGSDYYQNPWRMHLGRDIAVPVGSRVVAARDGVVEWAGEFDALGGCVVLWHPDVQGRTLYAHLSVIAVAVGEQVRAGWPIARSGNTGESDGPHLHFEVWLGCGAGGGDPYQLTRHSGGLPADPASMWQGQWPTEGAARP